MHKKKRPQISKFNYIPQVHFPSKNKIRPHAAAIILAGVFHLHPTGKQQGLDLKGNTT